MSDRLRGRPPIATTLDGGEHIIITGGRAEGNTTRQVDYAIQLLFSGALVLTLDHHERGNNPMSNRRLFTLIVERIHREHQHLRDKLSLDRNNFLISLND